MEEKDDGVLPDYVDQSVHDLRIIPGCKEFIVNEDGKSFFVNGNEDDVFTIHAWSEFSWGDFIITTYVLGESHAVMIRYKFQIVMFEVCACTQVSDQMKPVLLKNLKDDEVLGKHLNGHTYAFKKKYLDEAELMAMYDRFATLSQQEHVTILEHNFCDTAGCNHPVEPMTTVVVKVDKESDKIYIYSIHVYPDEPDQSKIAAYTESVITMSW